MATVSVIQPADFNHDVMMPLKNNTLNSRTLVSKTFINVHMVYIHWIYCIYHVNKYNIIYTVYMKVSSWFYLMMKSFVITLTTRINSNAYKKIMLHTHTKKTIKHEALPLC